jgi:hypothetical protein
MTSAPSSFAPSVSAAAVGERGLVVSPPVESGRRLPRFWLFQIGGWFTYGVVMALSRISMFPLKYMVVSKSILATSGFLLSLLLWRLYRNLLRRDPGVLRIVVVSVFASYLTAMVWTAIDNLADIPISAAMLGRTIVIRNTLQLLLGTVYNAFTLLAWSLLYFSVRHHDALYAERERSLRAEATAQRARLEALRYQLHPHFLFNTLNAISTLVVERQNDQAGQMIARLSDFLRLTLSAPFADEVTLAEEMDFIGRYLEIEQVRFGERLKVVSDVPADVLDARVPYLILQPVIENAVVHGIARREHGGTIAIRARRGGSLLRIEIVDDGPGARPEPGRERIGLGNTRERLECLYGTGQQLRVENGPGGTRVILEVPFRTAAS